MRSDRASARFIPSFQDLSAMRTERRAWRSGSWADRCRLRVICNSPCAFCATVKIPKRRPTRRAGGLSKVDRSPSSRSWTGGSGAALRARGHQLTSSTADSAFAFGGAQIVLRTGRGLCGRLRSSQGRVGAWPVSHDQDSDCSKANDRQHLRSVQAWRWPIELPYDGSDDGCRGASWTICARKECWPRLRACR